MRQLGVTSVLVSALMTSVAAPALAQTAGQDQDTAAASRDVVIVTAQRILAKSLARELGPKGVHVAYLIIDAVIDLPWQRERLPNAPDDFFISPKSIAAEVFHLAHQPKDAWSFLAEVRPFHEPW